MSGVDTALMTADRQFAYAHMESGGSCLALELDAFANANAGRKIHQAIHFIYLDKEIYCILMTFCKISIFIFHNFSFLSSNNLPVFHEPCAGI